MKSLNGACLFAYEVHRILPAKNELEDPKSLPDIQRAIVNGTLLNLIQQHVRTLELKGYFKLIYRFSLRITNIYYIAR